MSFTMQKADKIDLRRLALPPLKPPFKNPIFQLYSKQLKYQPDFIIISSWESQVFSLHGMGNTTQIKPSLSEEVGQNLVGTHSIASFFNVPKEPWQWQSYVLLFFLVGDSDLEGGEVPFPP